MTASTSGERLTAAISTIVAVAILGAAVGAQQARPQAGDRLARLESDLRFQLEIAFNTDPDEHRVRVAGLERSLRDWQRSSQTADDYRLLIVWFRDSIVSSMPGRVTAAPPMPEFSQPPLANAAPPRASLRVPSEAPPEPTPVSVAPAGDPPVALVHGTTVEKPIPSIDPSASGAPAASRAARPSHGTPASRPVAARSTLTAPSVEAPQLVDVDAGPAVQVNLAELNARIRGFNHGLAEVEATMVASDKLDGRRLARLVTQLEQLAGQYGFVQLYYNSLSAEEQGLVAAPRPLAATVRMVEQQLAQDARGDFLKDFDAPNGNELTLAERIRIMAAAVDDAE